MTLATRECSTCFELLPHTAEFFYRNGNSGNRSPTVIALHSSCKKCELERGRWKGLYGLYGITKDQFEAMMRTQGGVCAICGKSSSGRMLDVDHNHETGEIRGLLCHKCNKGLGLMGDDPDRLEVAAQYLRKYTP